MSDKIICLLLFLIPFISAKIREGRMVERVENNLIVEKFDVTKRYKPDWADLDTRPLPQWYDQAKIGIFLHWGVFSVPSFGSEWFWWYLRDANEKYTKFMDNNYPPDFTYQEFAPMFTAEFFDPYEWATLFQKAGAKYIVLTSKHHEGFTMFPSKRSFSWNSVEIGPKRDIVGELAESIRSKGLKFGVYHSLYEWFNPIYLEDKNKNEDGKKSRVYPDTKLWPDIKQLVTNYKPSVLWSDGDWDFTADYWNSTGLLAWLYNDSPVKDVIVTNDRWGKNCYGKHGDFYNYQDRYNPGKLLHHKWENAFTLDKKSWGYRRDIQLSEVMTFDEMLFQIVSAISCGGNALINVGPTKEGTITPIFQERLLSLGAWLEINGEAIYESSPWLQQNDTVNDDVWYTCRKAEYNAASPTSKPMQSDTVTAIYAVVLKWPKNSQLIVGDVMPLLHTGNYKIQMLGNDDSLTWNIISGTALISLPDKATVNSTNAWTLKFTLK